MENQNQPLVSIGVPLFNCEKELVQALDLLIEQDYPNLEIIISDNGSTDSTPEICAEYVKKDSRIKYSRSEENLGAIWNFNQVFKLSTGEYFMWAAHDDKRERSFVRECVEKMEQSPDAVLCQAHTIQYVEGRSEILAINDLASFGDAKGLVPQYRETLKNFPATAIYGLYRSSAMRKTHMFEKIIAADLGFIQELSSYGRFVQVPHVLFYYIIREKWNTVDQDYYVFSGKKKKPWWYLPFIIVFYNHCKRVATLPIHVGVKLRLWSILIGHEIGQVTLKIFIKIFKLICPESCKEKLGIWIYWRWMHPANIKVDCEDLFLNRVIKPRLGWWR